MSALTKQQRVVLAAMAELCQPSPLVPRHEVVLSRRAIAEQVTANGGDCAVDAGLPRTLRALERKGLAVGNRRGTCWWITTAGVVEAGR